MSRRIPQTPNSQIRSGFRSIWLRSRERAHALRAAHHCCERCGVKGRAKDTRNGPKQKLEVHHRDGIVDWDALVSLFRRRILPNPDRLEVLCPECHKKEHSDDR